MQVNNDPQRRVDSSKKRAADKAKDKLSAKAPSFLEQMTSAETVMRQETLDSLLSSVDQTAQDFMRDPSEEKFKAYQQAIREFTRQAMNRAYKVERVFDDKNRLYTVVREVDEKLARLAEETLSKQTRPMELVARVSEIRGMLLDMFI